MQVKAAYLRAAQREMGPEIHRHAARFETNHFWLLTFFN